LEKWRARPKRKRRNVIDKRTSKANAVQHFAKQYKAQKGVEPNDRRFEKKIAERVKRMKPEAVDQLLRDGEE
jgi:hypothetical protein